MSSKRAIRTVENIRFAKLLSIELKKENIDHFYLKGFAIQKFIYNDFSIRPLTDFDIFINLEDVKKTIRILKELNFNTSKWDNLKDKNFIVIEALPEIGVFQKLIVSVPAKSRISLLKAIDFHEWFEILE